MILGTRRAIQEALGYAYASDSSMSEYLTYLCRIDKSPGNGTEQFARSMQYAMIRAAINDQSQPIPAWLHYCYGPDVEAAQKGRQQRMVGIIISAKMAKGPMKVVRRERIEKLCLMAVEDYRLRTLNDKELPSVEYAKLMGTDPSNFVRDWGGMRNDALAELNTIDATGVAHVSITVKQIREAEVAA